MKRRLICVALSILLIVGLNLQVGSDVSAAGAKLNYNSYKITGKYSFQLKLKNSTGKIKWSSSNKKVAKVSKKGKVTSMGNGKCNIIAKVGSNKYVCKVKVRGLNVLSKKKAFKKTALDLTSVSLDVSGVNFNKVGDAVIDEQRKNTIQLKVFNAPKDATVSWKSSDEGVATVNKSGVVTAVKEGNCTVTATVNGKDYDCSVKVTDLKDADKVDTQNNIYKHLKYLNDARMAKKIAPLKLDKKLNKAAKIRVEEVVPSEVAPSSENELMVQTDSNFSHTRPNGKSYKSVFKQVKFKLPSVCYVGENVVHSCDHAESLNEVAKRAFDNLWADKAHRDNIIKKEFTKVGIGYHKAAKFTDADGHTFIDTFWTEEFYGD